MADIPETSVTSTTTTVTVADQVQAWIETNGYVLLGLLIGLFALLIIVAIACYCFMKKRKWGRGDQGVKKARAIIDGSTDLTLAEMAGKVPIYVYLVMTDSTHPTKTETKAFKTEAGKLNRMDKKDAQAFAESIRYKNPKAPDGEDDLQRVYDMEFATVPFARYPKQPLLETAQLPLMGQFFKDEDRSGLQATIFHDLYGGEFYVSQAPLEYHYMLHFEVLWQRSVGVIVWLGPLGKGFKNIKPYVGKDFGQKKDLKRFNIKTLTMDKYSRLFDQFSFGITNVIAYTYLDPRGMESREIFIIHIDWWPTTYKELMAKGRRHTEKAALMVEMIRSMRLQQEKKLLPGVMVHCSTGLEPSCTFFAIYLSRQMQLRFDAVNIQAVMRLIDRMRHNAFSSKTVLDQVEIVYAVILEFIKEYPRPWIMKIKEMDPNTKIDKHLLLYAPRKAAPATDQNFFLKKQSFETPTTSVKLSSKSALGAPKPIMPAPQSLMKTTKSIVGLGGQKPLVGGPTRSVLGVNGEQTTIGKPKTTIVGGTRPKHTSILTV